MKLKEKVHEDQSPYQRIEIYETEYFGTLMTLNGLVMLTDRDNFIYHEMLVHPALFTHPEPKRVLVVGGGDCGTLCEVLKHPGVESAELVEIDERVTRVAERFFPQLCAANNDPRAHFHFTDGIKWIADASPGSYDVIIVDSTDPIGPAAGLYSQAFYRHCCKALGPQGVLVAQSESPLFHMDLILEMRAAMKAAGLPRIATLNFPQCTYPSGWWTATMACKGSADPSRRAKTATRMPFPTRYYNHAIHAAALAAPQFLSEAWGL